MKDRFGYTAILEAVGVANIDVMKAYTDIWDRNGHNLTEYNLPVEAAKEGYVETVKELLVAGADVKDTDEGGMTAFDHARDDEMRKALGEKKDIKKGTGGIQDAR
jgi:ankyrin repeat protein